MSGWTPVGERLPDDEIDALAWLTGASGARMAVCYMAPWRGGEARWFLTDGNGRPIQEPTHWRELPEEPTDAPR